MKTKKRQKICYNCNAEVDLEVIVCPYCGTDMLEEFDLKYDSNEDKSLSAKQTIASLYPPPYQMQNNDQTENVVDDADEITEEDDIPKKLPSILPDLVLTLSSSLLGLILILFFFSVDGEINLQINNKYLVMLFIAAVPALLWSYRNFEED